MGLAERADVIVDFCGTAGRYTRSHDQHRARMHPSAASPDIPADPATTGQVMEFVVNNALTGASPTDPLWRHPGPLIPGC